MNLPARDHPSQLIFLLQLSQYFLTPCVVVAVSEYRTIVAYSIHKYMQVRVISVAMAEHDELVLGESVGFEVVVTDPGHHFVRKVFGRWEVD